MVDKRRWFSKGEKEAFKAGLDDYPGFNPNNHTVSERESYDRGKKIGKSKDYQMAERYTEHMNYKYGQTKKTSTGGHVSVYDKKGRRIGIDGTPLPTAYQNYKDMQKDPELKKSIYFNYDC